MDERYARAVGVLVLVIGVGVAANPLYLPATDGVTYHVGVDQVEQSPDDLTAVSYAGLPPEVRKVIGQARSGETVRLERSDSTGAIDTLRGIDYVCRESVCYRVWIQSSDGGMLPATAYRIGLSLVAAYFLVVGGSVADAGRIRSMTALRAAGLPVVAIGTLLAGRLLAGEGVTGAGPAVAYAVVATVPVTASVGIRHRPAGTLLALIGGGVAAFGLWNLTTDPLLAVLSSVAGGGIVAGYALASPNWNDRSGETATGAGS